MSQVSIHFGRATTAYGYGNQVVTSMFLTLLKGSLEVKTSPYGFSNKKRKRRREASKEVKTVEM
jgi:hypothetical protein